MSRGLGKIERFIIERVTQDPDAVQPIPILADRYADAHGIEDTRHLRSSFRRAANTLWASDTIRLFDLYVPTRVLEDGNPHSYRKTLCVASIDTELTHEKHVTAAQMMMLFSPTPPSSRHR